MTVTIPYEAFVRVAHKRRPGYLAEVDRLGIRDGELLTLSIQDYKAIASAYRFDNKSIGELKALGCGHCGKAKHG